LVQPDSIEVYTVTFLRCGERYLLLQRSPDKPFAPLRWTGLGGHVEPDEFSSIYASALREVWEEAGIAQEGIQNFTLRRALLVNRPDAALRLILYFTGVLQQLVLPSCPEGQLFWVDPEQLDTLDIIETTRPVLACLIEDMLNDPQGNKSVAIGLGVFDSSGSFQGVLWG
jgi:8-oxo-dGTP diphosphatase